MTELERELREAADDADDTAREVSNIGNYDEAEKFEARAARLRRRADAVAAVLMGHGPIRAAECLLCGLTGPLPDKKGDE